MRRFTGFLSVLTAAAAFAVPAASAGLLDPITQVLLPGCGATGYPFAPWGDRAAYYGFGNNGFESGSNGWALSGGYVGSGNEPFYVNGSGARSLTLPQGAGATSPSFCINLLDPAVRLFARGTSGGTLRIQVVFRGLTGNLTGVLNYADETGTGSWTPSDRVSSLLALPLGTTSAQIRLTAVAGTWQVDDAFIDPMIARLG